MLTYEDCIALAELTEEEVAAIAAHEHVPEMIAVELGNYLVHDRGGVPRIRRIILDDIAHARARGDLPGVARLKGVLRQFVATHRPTPAG